MGQKFGKMKFSKKKIFVDKIDLTCESIVSNCIKCGDIEYELYYPCMNSVSGLCLCLRDTALYLNCHLNCVDG